MARPVKYHTDADRITSKVAVSDAGCWEWTGFINENGYGKVNDGKGRMVRAHRLSYEAFVGPIPDGMTIDHLCRVRHCVNPEHLEPVTNKTNILRGTSFSAINASKTECSRGHEYTEENTYRDRKGRSCRACRRAAGIAASA